MNLQDEIKNLTLSFFEIAGDGIVYEDGIYHISIGQKYRDHFGAKISITFDGDSALKHGSELIVPGSRIFETVMDICTGKGSIAAKKLRVNSAQTIIRYHFFVVFSGKHSVSKLMYVDINPDAHSVEENLGELEERMRPPDECLDTKDVISSYLLAGDAIQAKSNALKAEFVGEATEAFQEDLRTLAKKYNTRIRELDGMMNRGYDRDKRFRFETVEKIKDLESEKARLEIVLQEKHRINIEYSLIACEIIGP